ncbi:MAG: serine hydrolase [Gemmatimonadaceae bacterium]
MTHRLVTHARRDLPGRLQSASRLAMAVLLVQFLSVAPRTLVAQDMFRVHTRQAGRAVVSWRTRSGTSCRETDAVVGVAILDLTDNRTAFFLHADELFPTASTIKIAVLAELYRQHERAAGGGAGARLTDLYTVDAKDVVGGSDIMAGLTPGVSRITNRDLATMMIAVSDNSATNVLIDRVGMDAVNAWLSQLGLTHTRLRRHMMDVKAAQEGRENTATPHELVTLVALHRGQVLKSLTVDYFAMLGTHKDSYIPRLLPTDVTVANKPGDLDAVRNDAGIVFVPNRPFAIAVMTTFGRDERASELAIARNARAAWMLFDRLGKRFPVGTGGALSGISERAHGRYSQGRRCRRRVARTASAGPKPCSRNSSTGGVGPSNRASSVIVCLPGGIIGRAAASTACTGLPVASRTPEHRQRRPSQDARRRAVRQGVPR